jgi:hypothetical protein
LRELLAARDLGLDLDAVFDVTAYTRHAQEIVGRLPGVDDEHVHDSVAFVS